MANDETVPKIPYLHCYAPRREHDALWVEGTRAGLEALVEVIRKALASETESCTFYQHAMAGDGEGYDVSVEIRSDEAMRTSDVPYAVPRHKYEEVLDRLHNAEAELLRLKGEQTP